MHRAKKYILWAIALLLGLPLLLTLVVGLLLYVPVVQDWAVGLASHKASEATGLTIRLDQLRLRFPLVLSADKVLVLRTPKDTLARLGRLDVDVKMLPLLRGRAIVPTLGAKDLYLNYRDSTGLSLVQVRLEELQVRDLSVFLREERVDLASLRTHGGYVLYQSTDTVPAPKEKKEPLRWVINANLLRLEQTAVDVDMPLHQLLLNTDVGLLELRRGRASLERNRYEVGAALLDGGKLAYARNRQTPKEGLDYEHLALKDIHIGAKDIVSELSEFRIQVLEASLRERSGLSLEQLQGKYQMDSQGMQLQGLLMRTSASNLYADLQLPWSVMRGDTTAVVRVEADASLGMADIRALTGTAPALVDTWSTYQTALERKQINSPIQLSLQARGTLADFSLEGATLLWDGVVDANVSGNLYHLTKPLERTGKLDLSVGMQQHASSLLSVYDPKLAQNYHIPSGMTLRGKALIRRGNYELDLALRDQDALASLKGHYFASNTNYQAQLDLSSIDLRRYMPTGQLGLVNAELNLKGQGMDFLRPSTYLSAVGRLRQLTYAGKEYRDITLDANLRRGELTVSVNSPNPSANLALQLDGTLSNKQIYTGIVLESERLDLADLGFSSVPLAAKFRMEAELTTDLKDSHRFVASATGVEIAMEDGTIRPEEVKLVAESTPQQSSVHTSSGDLRLEARAETGLSGLMRAWTDLQDLARREQALIVAGKKRSEYRLEDFASLLPSLRLNLTMGQENALRPYLKQKRIALSALGLHLHHKVREPLYTDLKIQDLRLDTLRLREVNFSIRPQYIPSKYVQRDSLTFLATASVERSTTAHRVGDLWQGWLKLGLHHADINLQGAKLHGDSLHRVLLASNWNGVDYRLWLPDQEVLLSGNKLKVNSGNYISLDKHTYWIGADLQLEGDKLGKLSLWADQGNKEEQTIQIGMRQLSLSTLRDIGLPDIDGQVTADLTYSRKGGWTNQPTITGDIALANFRYEDKKLGHFTTALFYEPRNDHSHYITGEVSYNGSPALSLDAIYYPRRVESPLEGTATLTHFPLELANPFLLAYHTTLSGTAGGSLAISGQMTSPSLSGELALNQSSLNLEDYSTKVVFGESPLRIERSRLYFDNYTIRSGADADHPIYLNGSVNLVGDKATYTDLSLRTDNLLVFNQERPQTDHSLVYGKLLTSANLSLKGLASSLRVRGQVSVLTGTNCNYIMREGGLNTQDQMSGLVSFVDFADTVFAAQPAVKTDLGGLDVSLNLAVDPTVRMGVDLTADRTDYARIQGGGNLQLFYPPYGDMKLTGRFQMTGGGDLSYTLPVVGTKKFTIDPTSYLSWSGDMYNPYLNLLATQKVRSNVGDSNGSSQKVNFLVSIKAQNTIDQINLAFDLSAPENLSLQNSLTAMTAEERGKQALGLMATGIYLASENLGSNLSFGSALTSLLQSQINQTAGKLLQGTDLSIGMEVNDGTSGKAASTDYTYSFSRRFYNDRIRIVVGGKVQTGNPLTSQSQTLIDNVAIEYQLDKIGEQSLRLFHKRITDDLLEGEYTETGVGYTLRRKLYRLSDLFRWNIFKDWGKTQKTQTDSVSVSTPSDSVGATKTIQKTQADSVSVSTPSDSVGTKKAGRKQ